MTDASRRLVFLLGLAGFMVMADNWVVSPILPAISKSVGVAPEAAGVLIAAYMLPFGIFQRCSARWPTDSARHEWCC